MKQSRTIWARFLILTLMAALAIFPLIGCAGSDGDDGARGPAGSPGEDGEPGVALDDVEAINLVLDLTQTVSYNAATGALTIHFFLKDSGEDPVDTSDDTGVDVTSDAYELRVYASELVPNVTAENPGPNWVQLFNERGTPAAGSPLPGTLTLVNASTGEYNYRCATALAATTNVIRVTVRARWRETINGERIVFANPVNASYDFVQAAPGTPITTGSGADMASNAACNSCHGARIGDVGHGGGYTQVKTCNHCHNLDFQSDDQADLAFMIHRIHNAGIFNGLGDFSEVTYPQHIYTCSKCHAEDGTAPDFALAYENPTRHNCTSCHDNISFVDPPPAGMVLHTGQARSNDSLCAGCHLEADIINAHMPIPPSLFDARNVSEFNVTITMTPPANGTHYVTDEAPIVTVTLADSITNTPVAGTVYTANQDGEGVAGDLTEGLSTANLYVYGPRADAVPVLTTGSTTDGGIQQSHSLFPADTGGVPNPDTRVITDATGYKYQLMNIPASLEAGTYMVRFEGEDYGSPSDLDYVTASSTHITFQVGTATEEPKVSGEACLDCHGDTIMHLEGSHPHHVPFDTDACLGCHDLSGNYAEYIGNRAHAIHSASATGDLHGSSRIWTEVTFPRPANNCLTCHTNEDADTPVWRIPWMPACGGCHGVDSSADPDDPAFDGIPDDVIIGEAAAAQHMEQQGGVPDAAAPATLQCLVCHGEDRLADPFETHQLLRFRPLPVDPNE